MSMSMVAAGGWSPRFDRVYGGANAPEAVNRSETRGRVERNERDDDDTRRISRDDDGPGRRNPLVGALMQALKGLMAEAGTTTPAPAAAAGPTAVPAPTTTSAPVTMAQASPATTSDTGDLKDAAVAFAHELFSALRSVGNDEVGRGRHHHHHHHGHGHGHRREGGGYGNLAQGLRDLARTIDVPKAASTATPSASTPPAVPAPTPSPVPASATPVVLPPVATDATSPPTGAASAPPTIDSLLPALAAAPAGASVEININIQIKFSTAAAPTAPAGATPAKAESPLLAAFKQLMDKLNPSAADSGSTATTTADAADATSPEAKLKAFLLGIADALTGGRSGSNAADTAAPVGSLISVAA
jgi:hypothetical protein